MPSALKPVLTVEQLVATLAGPKGCSPERLRKAMRHVPMIDDYLALRALLPADQQEEADTARALYMRTH